MKKYQNLIDNIPESQIKELITKMVKQYDLTGEYCDGIELLFDYEAERFLKSNINFSSEFIELLNQEAEVELETAIKERAAQKTNLLYYFNEEPSIESIKRRIYKSLFDFLVFEAKRLSENREQLRLEVGSCVNYEECDIQSAFGDLIEFYKDGGWGIGDENGAVIVKNHLKEQPSKINNLFGVSYIKYPYRIIQDRDTKKYGVLSLESYEETLHCLYDKIEIIAFDKESDRHFFIKVMKNGKWGCFDEKCVLIIDINYDEICLTSEFLECTRDGEVLISDTLESPGYESICAGKKDLYNAYGELLIGGFDHLTIDNDYLLLYFGTFYDNYYEDVDNFWSSFRLSKLFINYENSLCLVLDNEFKTIIQNEEGFYRVPKGRVFDSLEELKRLIPTDLLFKYHVDLSHWGRGVIYLHNYVGEQFFIPKFLERGFESQEEMDRYVIDPLMEISDRFVDDEIITIIKIGNDKKVIWCDNVNELLYFGSFYRKGSKMGLLYDNGLDRNSFDAITVNTHDGKTYAAKIEYCPDIEDVFVYNEKNVSKRLSIHFYMMEEGHFVQMTENQIFFNPTKYKWIPNDFIDSFYRKTKSDCFQMG